MIILVNGPFGVGKSTTANLLVEMDGSRRMFDPELVGAVLHRLVDPDEILVDYQDMPLWRHLVVDVAHRLHDDAGRHLVMPMNLWRYEYFSEIVEGIRDRGIEVVCFRLTCTPETLTSRILGRADEEASHEWCLRHRESGLAAATDARFGHGIDTEHLDAHEVAAEIDEVLATRERDGNKRGPYTLLPQ